VSHKTQLGVIAEHFPAVFQPQEMEMSSQKITVVRRVLDLAPADAAVGLLPRRSLLWASQMEFVM